MELSEILARCDHTLLSVTATGEEIRNLCDEAIEYGCASPATSWAPRTTSATR